MLDVDGAAVVVGKLESCHLEAVCSVILDYQADDLFPVEQNPAFLFFQPLGGRRPLRVPAGREDAPFLYASSMRAVDTCV